MTATIFIDIKEMNPQFIRDLQQRYPEGEVELKVRQRRPTGRMSEEQFWEIIGLLNWEQEENDEAVIEPAIRQLAAMPVDSIYGFQDFLSEKLFALDAERYAKQIGEDAYREGKYFSVDNFLYARCCVVANSRDAYKEVLQNPSAMPKDLTFEALLNIAPEAFERKTGQRFAYLPAFDYETYSNEDDWL